jgi:hypothetical protein
MTAFPELAMSDEDGSPLVTAPEVRATSLLGSSTVLRALATAYYRLTRKKDERDRPVTPEMTHDEVKAPGARSQEIKLLADLMTAWALDEQLEKGPLG